MRKDRIQSIDDRKSQFETQATLSEVTSVSSKTFNKWKTLFDRLLGYLYFRNSDDDTILDEKQEEIGSISLNSLLTYANWRDRLLLLIGTLLALLVGGLQPTVTLLGGMMENLFISHHQPIRDQSFRNKGYSIVYWYLIGGTVTLILSFIQVIVLQTACTGIVTRMKEAFLRSVLHQDSAWIDVSDPGSLSSKLADNLDKVREGVGEKWGLVVRGFAMFLSSCAISLFFDWKTTLIMITLVPLSTITMFLSAKVSEGPLLSQMDANSKADGVSEESISAWKTVAASNAQSFFVKKYSKLLSECLKWTRKVNLITGVLEGLMFVELYFFMAGGFLYGTLSYFSGRIEEPGHVFIVVNTVAFGAYFVSVLGPHLHSLVRARLAASIIHQIAQRKPREDPYNGEQIQNLKGKIEFLDVTFRYSSRKGLVLKGISFSIQPGQNIAFVGASGCGKSTIIGLISHIYSPISGEIRIDDKNLSMLESHSLRKKIGLVPQEPPLFSGTILENVRLGREASIEEIIDVCEQASAHDFISNLEKGYETMVGYGGVSLSGGQKQRIGIARALLGKPKILLLDEATSALDTQSEESVLKALEKTQVSRTTISIAHRLSSIRNSDTIFVLDKGTIVERGKHSELLSLNGVYASLARAQSLNEIDHKHLLKAKIQNKKTFKAVAKAYTSLLHLTNLTKPQEKSRNHQDQLVPRPRRRSLETGLRSSFRGAAQFGRVLSNSITSDHILDDSLPEAQQKTHKSWIFLWRFYKDSLKKHKFSIILAQLISLIRGLELPLFCCFQVLIYDALAATKETYVGLLIKATILFATLGVFCLITITFASVLSGQSADICVNELKERVLEKVLLRDGHWFETEKSPSACIITLSQQPENCKAALDSRFCVFSSDFSALLVCLGIAFYFCWQMGLLAVGICMILTGALFALTFGVERAMKRRVIEDTTPQLALEMITHVRSIQLLAAKDFFLKTYSEKLEFIKKFDRKVTILQAITQALTQGFVFFCEASAFALGIHLIFIGAEKANQILLASMCVSFSGWALFFMQPSFNDVSRAASASSALYELLDGEVRALDKGSSPNLDGSLETINLTFSYPSRPDHQVASKLNVEARSGSSIALVGESGCGKSTLIQLIQRFYRPSSGVIKIGGFSIEDLSLIHLRNHIALVGQEPVLFKGTILENITLGVENVDLDKIRKAAGEANCADFIEALPLGYETEIGDRGKGLSGGQKQRIAIARALIRDPKILLLDEATSALDTQSEQAVQMALLKASKSRTTISIAHRLSTIQTADQIFYIVNGKVMERGTHQELLSSKGAYSNLVHLQTLS